MAELVRFHTQSLRPGCDDSVTLYPPSCGLRRAAFGDRLEPAADLLRVAAEVVQARQGGEALEAENTLEERGRPVVDGASLVPPRLGDEAALDKACDDRVGCDPADPSNVGAAA